MVVDEQGSFFPVGTKPEVEGICFDSLQGSVGKVFFGNLHDATKVEAAGYWLQNGMYCAHPADAVLSAEEAVCWGQANKPHILPDGLQCREVMEWSVAMVSAQMSALASMMDVDKQQLHIKEACCQVEQDAIKQRMSATLKEQIK